MATTIGDLLDKLTVRGELYRKLSDDTIECYACGHRCKIREGRRGICQVRFNQGGELRVPWGYVAALQSDPIEKKPFFHVMPGTNALTFGMLGCDFHCGYCFTGDTMVLTNRGPVSLQDAFELGVTLKEQPDGDISIPFDLKAITSSGSLRKVKAVFRHPYEGEMVKIKPYYLPSITCTPDHRVYATDDENTEPYLIQAKDLKINQYLAVPRRFSFSSLPAVDAMEYIASHNEQVLCREAREFARIDLKDSRQFVQFAAEGRSFSQNRMITRHENNDIAPNIIEMEKFYLVPVREIRCEPFKGHVFNMEVEEEHNYLANFLLVSNCQNWLTSQAMRDPDSDISANYIRKISPQEMVQLAHRTHASTVVSSYNEPLITSEWAVEIFKEAKAAGLMCAYVSNGNNTPEVMEYIRPYISAYKVDLKCMQDKNYRKLGGVLQNTLDGIKRAHEMGLWVEIVTLTIPGFNDSNEELWDAARFIAGVSKDIPWHVTAFHKDYKMTDYDNTDAKTLLRAAEIGREAGLQFVYAGNLPGRTGEYEDTFCPQCNERLIQRSGYTIHEYRITGEGTCPKCNAKVPGIWPKDPSQVTLNGMGIPLPVR
ncbi:MAG: radical SAM protein [Chloroflexi bacterium]|nr:MAG: radical SAM protein [Chloroflexota bacterium]